MRTIGLVLADETDEFQGLLAREAAAAASRAGFKLQVRGCAADGYAPGAQVRLIRSWLDAAAAPEALLVLAAGERGLEWTVREAARRGIHWIGLNRTEDDLDAIRDEFRPSAVIASVCVDERACGRIQARIVCNMLASRGRVLYVAGEAHRLTSRERAAGFAAGMAHAGHEVVQLAVGSAAEARDVVRSSLRIALHARRRLDAIVCQSDALAEGALEALRLAHGPWRPGGLPPVVGCDGTPGKGQALVAAGRLAATVVVPRTAATAIGLLSLALERGTPVPAVTLLAGHPWPETAQSLRPPA